MRISTAYPQQFNINSMFDQQSKLNETQLKISSGLKYLTPAENPMAAASALGFEQSIGEANQLQDNIATANQRLSLEETTLASVIDTIQRLQELGLQGVSDSGNSVVARNAIATEFDQLNQHLIGLANTRNSNGEYLFAGVKSTVMPFSQENANPTTPAVVTTPVTNINTVAANAVTTSVKTTTPDPIITVLDAAAGGSGVTEKYYNLSSAGGEFRVDYDMKSQPDQMDIYVNGSNTPIASTNNKVSGTGSLIISGDKLPAGSQVKVVVTGDNGTVWDFKASYSGVMAATTAAESATAAIQVTTPPTPVTAAITAATVNTPVSAFTYFGSNTQRSIQIGTGRTITDGDTGTATFTSAKTGQTLFDTVKNFATELRADKPTLETLQALDDAFTQISTVRSNVGARMNALDKQKLTNDDFILNTKTALSQVADLDYTTAITNLNAQQLSLQAAQQSYAKVQSMSLFKYF